MSPQRIQRKRTKGWRMPEGAVYVGRPTRWGNPFVLDTYEVDYPDADTTERRRMAVSDFRGMVAGKWDGPGGAEYEHPSTIRALLRGLDLACWCPLEDAQGNRVPCHADVLLEIANSEVAP